MSCVHHLERWRRVPRRAKVRFWGHYRTNILSWSGQWLWICYEPRYGWYAQWVSAEQCYSALVPTRSVNRGVYEETCTEIPRSH